jgi:hypothetical protein
MTAVEPPAFKLLTWADLERMPLKSRAQSFREKIGAAVEAMPAVETRGDKLGRILWRGRQWSVTEDGLEALDGCYFIAKNRLAQQSATARLADACLSENLGGCCRFHHCLPGGARHPRPRKEIQHRSLARASGILRAGA